MTGQLRTWTTITREPSLSACMSNLSRFRTAGAWFSWRTYLRRYLYSALFMCSVSLADVLLILDVFEKVQLGHINETDSITVRWFQTCSAPPSVTITLFSRKKPSASDVVSSKKSSWKTMMTETRMLLTANDRMHRFLTITVTLPIYSKCTHASNGTLMYSSHLEITTGITTILSLWHNIHNCTQNICITQGDHSFRKIIFHDFPGPTEMNFYDLSALQFSRNKRNMTYECIPKLAVTVPAGCSSEKCLH